MWKSRIKPRTSTDRIIPDRQATIEVTDPHFVNGSSMTPPFPENLEVAYFGMGCFWGAEREFWMASGVYTTAVGYAGGATMNPTYDDVCSGRTGHTEAVLVVFDPDVVSYQALLKRFWEAHDPTQGMRQGPDSGGRRSTRPPIGSSPKPPPPANGTQQTFRRRDTGTSRLKSHRHRTSSTPRTITSSTSQRTWHGQASTFRPSTSATHHHRSTQSQRRATAECSRPVSPARSVLESIWT